MLIGEYSYERDIQVKQQEAREEAWEEAVLMSQKIIEELKRNPLLTSAQIAERLGCDSGTVERIRKSMS